MCRIRMHPWQAAKEALAAGSAGDVTVGEAKPFFLGKTERKNQKFARENPFPTKKIVNRWRKKSHHEV